MSGSKTVHLGRKHSSNDEIGPRPSTSRRWRLPIIWMPNYVLELQSCRTAKDTVDVLAAQSLVRSCVEDRPNGELNRPKK
jgi:hypothetical protein